jgi:organic radical activating enzyme
MKTYKINEIFYSLQGEGVRAGTPNLFLRFSSCNLKCNKNENGFDCDTEFESGSRLTLNEIIVQLKETNPLCKWIILTGGEPALQIDDELLDRLHHEGYQIAIESNGTKELSSKIDWICISPKTAEHTLEQLKAHEVKYVRSHGMAIPQTRLEAEHYLISPAFEADGLPPKNLQWCIDLCRKNPPWRLSLQQHKLWGVR